MLQINDGNNNGKMWARRLGMLGCAVALGFIAATVLPNKLHATEEESCDDRYGTPAANGCDTKKNASGATYYDASTCNAGYDLTGWCECWSYALYGDNCYPDA